MLEVNVLEANTISIYRLQKDTWEVALSERVGIPHKPSGCY